MKCLKHAKKSFFKPVIKQQYSSHTGTHTHTERHTKEYSDNANGKHVTNINNESCEK